VQRFGILAKHHECSREGKDYQDSEGLYSGTAFILEADPEQYSTMIGGFKNASLAGQDEWPKNVTEAYNYLSKWEGEDNNGPRARNYEGLSFATEDGRERGPQPWHVKLTCRNCNKKGHITAFC
jgi:hypothetical protein